LYNFPRSSLAMGGLWTVTARPSCFNFTNMAFIYRRQQKWPNDLRPWRTKSWIIS
jgi:hypothetical protein